jgi:magnesium transporter
MTQNLNHYEKILSRAHSNYLAQISIEMTDANNQINDVLSKLTALGTILIPMNLVTGTFSTITRSQICVPTLPPQVSGV